MRSRPAVRDDVPALAELVRACNVEHRAWAGRDLAVPSLAEEALEWDLRFAAAGAWVRVAEDDRERLVGVVALRRATVSRTDRTPIPGLAHVNAVFVAPGRRRRGVAGALLDEALAAMREQGYDRAQLWTLAGSPAERFYTARGWTPDGRREPYPPMGLEVVAYVRAV